ncbi:hypothetical protein UCRPC4_g00161 [Phaeomoniella chlamydospora]|uniref:Uncharacterized protein n=1 Tax=Phaeomoniella chlamydospora TaxID=158046 RepID=A0A0G2F4E8_PHACM|nr:hypothetical protein UCRPC4_g00161 [Phaeomoniella chlamydospora]
MPSTLEWTLQWVSDTAKRGRQGAWVKLENVESSEVVEIWVPSEAVLKVSITEFNARSSRPVAAPAGLRTDRNDLNPDVLQELTSSCTDLIRQGAHRRNITSEPKGGSAAPPSDHATDESYIDLADLVHKEYLADAKKKKRQCGIWDKFFDRKNLGKTLKRMASIRIPDDKPAHNSTNPHIMKDPNTYNLSSGDLNTDKANARIMNTWEEIFGGTGELGDDDDDDGDNSASYIESEWADFSGVWTI